MAVIGELRVFGDDSGDETDRKQNKVISLACYLSELDRWQVFEQEWGEVLGDNHVPYLHMKEWWNDKKDTYRHLKDDPKKEATFFMDLAGVIKRNIRYCANCTVRLDDLDKFNSDFHQEIRAYPLALYGCMIELRKEEKNHPIMVTVDKITKPYKQIESAKNYAKSDTWEDLQSEKISILPLEDEESFKTVLPMQASDWMAWEVRKALLDRLGWPLTEEERKTLVGVHRSYERWKPEFKAEHGREPRERKSAWALYKATEISGHDWDYELIRAAHLNRHKNGWICSH